MRKCCVENCVYNDDAAGNNKYITFFSFPKNEDLKREWKRIINLKGKVTNKLVCSEHFEKKMIHLRGHQPILVDKTIPTIFASTTRIQESFSSSSEDEYQCQPKRPCLDISPLAENLMSSQESTDLPESDENQTATDEMNASLIGQNEERKKDIKIVSQFKIPKKMILKKALKSSETDFISNFEN